MNASINVSVSSLSKATAIGTGAQNTTAVASNAAAASPKLTKSESILDTLNQTESKFIDSTYNYLNQLDQNQKNQATQFASQQMSSQGMAGYALAGSMGSLFSSLSQLFKGSGEEESGEEKSFANAEKKEKSKSKEELMKPKLISQSEENNSRDIEEYDSESSFNIGEIG
jgi:hypothetical protein